MDSMQDRRLGPLLAALLIGLAAVGAAFYLRPYEAEPEAGLLESDATVRVERRPFGLAFLPQAAPRRLGLAFYEEARVPPEAYAYIGRAAAASGYTAVIFSAPLNIACLAPKAFRSAVLAFPNVERWVLAGHGYGGSWAASLLTPKRGGAQAAGLVLLDSEPGLDLSASTLPVLSLSSARRVSSRGVSSPGVSSPGVLPPSARRVEISGGSEEQFGEYRADSRLAKASLPAVAQRRAGVEEILAFLGRAAAVTRKED